MNFYSVEVKKYPHNSDKESLWLVQKGDELRRIHHGACSLNKSADSRGARVRPLKRFEVKSLSFDKLRWYRVNSPSDFCQGAFLFGGGYGHNSCKDDFTEK